jgi:ABC-2 type transport system permease protein
VIPLAFVGYVPALALLDRTGPIGPPWLAWASPAIGVAFLLVCLRVWRFGVRHYRSTGS